MKYDSKEKKKPNRDNQLNKQNWTTINKQTDKHTYIHQDRKIGKQTINKGKPDCIGLVLGEGKLS